MVLATSQQEFSDADFRVVDNADQSKKLAFEVSGVTTATTRTVTIPDADGTLAYVSTQDRGTLGTVASTAGTLTTVGTKEYWYTKVGRLVALNFTITITTNGTGSGKITAAGIPFAALTSSGYVAIGTGRADGVSGKQLVVRLPSGGSTLTIANYDDTYPAASGEVLVGTIAYYAAS